MAKPSTAICTRGHGGAHFDVLINARSPSPRPRHHPPVGLQSRNPLVLFFLKSAFDITAENIFADVVTPTPTGTQGNATIFVDFQRRQTSNFSKKQEDTAGT